MRTNHVLATLASVVFMALTAQAAPAQQPQTQPIHIRILAPECQCACKQPEVLKRILDETTTRLAKALSGSYLIVDRSPEFLEAHKTEKLPNVDVILIAKFDYLKSKDDQPSAEMLLRCLSGMSARIVSLNTEVLSAFRADAGTPKPASEPTDEDLKAAAFATADKLSSQVIAAEPQLRRLLQARRKP